MSNNYEPTLAELASKYKSLGYDQYYAWDRYVADTGLKPKVDAKEFYRIYANATAEAVGRKLPKNWVPTHIDTLFNRLVQIKFDHGVYFMVWDNGVTGSDPEALHPTDRYAEVNNDK